MKEILEIGRSGVALIRSPLNPLGPRMGQPAACSHDITSLLLLLLFAWVRCATRARRTRIWRTGVHADHQRHVGSILVCKTDQEEAIYLSHVTYFIMRGIMMGRHDPLQCVHTLKVVLDATRRGKGRGMDYPSNYVNLCCMPPMFRFHAHVRWLSKLEFKIHMSQGFEVSPSTNLIGTGI